MTRIASLLVAGLLVAFVAASCMTAPSWTGAAVPNSQTIARVTVDSEPSQQTTINTDGQTNKQVETTLSLNANSKLRVLAFQSAALSNSTQASRLLTTNKTTRIIVPISKVENTSSIGAQNSNGFLFPTSLGIVIIVIILLIILAYLILRLLRDNDNAPRTSTRPPAPTVQPTSEHRKEQPRQIPINEAETEVERGKNSAGSADSQRFRSIPIDAQEEEREPEDNSK